MDCIINYASLAGAPIKWKNNRNIHEASLCEIKLISYKLTQLKCNRMANIFLHCSCVTVSLVFSAFAKGLRSLLIMPCWLPSHRQHLLSSKGPAGFLKSLSRIPAGTQNTPSFEKPILLHNNSTNIIMFFSSVDTKGGFRYGLKCHKAAHISFLQGNHKFEWKTDTYNILLNFTLKLSHIPYVTVKRDIKHHYQFLKLLFHSFEIQQF